jgi:catechol 2,3-dioxygenase-like lactoylglutathione lyase family enzyme
MEKSISWVLLTTDKYAASISFYRDLLAFQVEKEIPGEEFCQFKLKNCYLAIYGRKFLKEVIASEHLGTGGGAIYSFPDSADIDQDVADLKKLGVKFIKEPQTQPWGQRTAYFTDPDGHIWEIQQWLNK